LERKRFSRINGAGREKKRGEGSSNTGAKADLSTGWTRGKRISRKEARGKKFQARKRNPLLETA